MPNDTTIADLHVARGPSPSDFAAAMPQRPPADGRHVLKVYVGYFDALADGDKLFEVRRNDRAFQKGDGLLLAEWAPQRAHGDAREHTLCVGTSHFGRRDCPWTGRWLATSITYVFAGDPRWLMLQPGCVVLGLALPVAVQR